MINLNNIVIREASFVERLKVAEVTKASYAQYEKESDPLFWSQYEKSTESTLMNGEAGTRLLAEYEEKIAGSVLYCAPTSQNKYPEMRLLSVLPIFRNYGIAGALIDFCEQKAADEGFVALTLHTTILMKTAKAMYERRGYEPHPEIDFSPVPNFQVWGYIKKLKS